MTLARVWPALIAGGKHLTMIRVPGAADDDDINLEKSHSRMERSAKLLLLRARSQQVAVCRSYRKPKVHLDFPPG